jgi:hypothetical protein
MQTDDVQRRAWQLLHHLAADAKGTPRHGPPHRGNGELARVAWQLDGLSGSRRHTGPTSRFIPLFHQSDGSVERALGTDAPREDEIPLV